MNSIPPFIRVLGVVTVSLALGAFPVATGQAQPAVQAQTAASAVNPAQSTFCGNQPLCYETADFAATITDFRTSTSGGLKLIDVDVRFQNKTNQPLILGYVNGSGTALDDRGNRYGVWGPNGFRGIGLVNGGNNFDPKFNIRAGSYSDAQFELAWAPGQTAYGLTFELNLTVDEINTIEAGQHTLAGEFPLHYRGLANGVTGAAPGSSAFGSQGQGPGSSMAGLPPCGATATTLAGAANSAGGQTAAGANNAVSNASAALASFGSLFGKKKAATPAAPTAASATPCAPAATSNAAYAGTSAPTVNAAVPQTTAGTAPQSAPTTAATAPGAVMKSATTTGTVKPSPAIARTPAPPVTPAAKKTVVTPTAQKTAQ